MSNVFAVSGQHYLFSVQTFAHTVLSAGGDSYSYAFRSGTTQGVIDDVAQGKSELGVLFQTSDSAAELDAAFAKAGVKFEVLAESAPQVALPKSHPLVNAKSLSLDALSDYPYVYFEQEEGAGPAFAEEALASVPRSKSIAVTDRASLSELIVALNGYNVTSGILVGISDGSALATVPLETDVKLRLGVIVKEGEQLSVLGERFLSGLKSNLEKYARL
jgi:DNA-binding transcriptional LysR family regulator